MSLHSDRAIDVDLAADPVAGFIEQERQRQRPTLS